MSDSATHSAGRFEVRSGLNWVKIRVAERFGGEDVPLPALEPRDLRDLAHVVDRAIRFYERGSYPEMLEE